MKDRYLDFVNSSFGAGFARSIGLPKPEVLRRHRPDRPEFGGIVAIGAGPSPALFDPLIDVLQSIGMTSVAHGSAEGWLPRANRHGAMSGRFEPHRRDSVASDRVEALIFDATGIADSSELGAIYGFFHDALRSVARSGRVVVLGRPPETRADPRAWTAQRALEGMTRSLGKEARGGVSSNLLQVAEGADIEGALRFFLSPRSAYVSGQVIRIEAASVTRPADWSRPLEGRRALVTGAARGIGASIAGVLAALGAHVTGVDVPQASDALDQTMLAIEDQSPSGGAHAALVADIAAPEAPAELAAALLAMGGIDIVVHNAGITRDKTIAKMTKDAWDSVIDINLSAQERIDDALLAQNVLHDGGRIVGVSSISGIAGNLGQTNYATSKAGVIGRVSSMAGVLRARGMTINAVAPGFIETQMTAKIPFAIREAGRRMNSMSQGGQPVDVAETVAWLASPASAGISGQVVRVCGQSLIGA
ncbi:3-ketoacyl-ACP reductase [Caballeronia arationis]|jgi:3-oxoacyl-[acyl-carrier protein] reductase|uniref:3-oxoacyl-[acyl-carrier protein] reductase n=1 Tax=Caballeronia arationis TaxID=1777142 RepID=A0A7Z7N443_9BURK|nr:3-oxoacyl-ACP reductase [Caballeronia arationis]SAK74893.1 3-ketoacyl-ACP reductase [Caballeronia arationis]SOE81445.1 3-oxoacyl-[acyl-carrier protein] reductase [Caballeronia arationis]